MADSKLSALTATTTLIDSDEIYVNDGGVSKKITKAYFDDNIDIAMSQVNDVTATATELNYVDGVTSAIQTQIDTKAPIANPTFTGEVGIGAVNISETELGILEGATLTTTEINQLDGTTLSGSHTGTHSGTSSGTNTGDEPNGSTSVKGIVELATSAEAATGTDTTRVVTPSGLTYAFTSKDQLSTNGYTELPNGVIIQWGLTPSFDSTYALSFPKVFPSACRSINVTPTVGGTARVSSVTASGCTVHETVSGSQTVYWMAIGY